MIRDTHMGAVGPCGEYPAASGFAAEPFRPLTPEENARYLAAAAVFNACASTAAGAPQSQCPPGSSFQGGQDQFGNWQGKCVSTFTGQPTTELITAPARSSSSTPPAPSSSTTPPAPFGPRGSSGTPAPLPPRNTSIGPPPPTGTAIGPPPPTGINYDLHPPSGQDTAPASFLATVPTWMKWAAAGGAALLLFSGTSKH